MNHPTLLFLNLGGSEIAVIMLFVLLFFGADKVPELARGLGKGIRQFKDAMNGIEQEVQKATNNIQKEVQKTIGENTTSETMKPTIAEPVKETVNEPVKGTVAKEDEKSE